MPVVACTCGARLKAPDHPKGGRAKCPKCGQPVIVPPAAAKREVGASVPSAAVSTQRPMPSAAAGEEPAPLEMLEKLMSASTVERASPAAKADARSTSRSAAASADNPESIELLYDLADGAAVAAEAPRTAVQPVQQPRTAGYARDEYIAASAKPRGALVDATSGPRRGFWKDAAYAYVYPFATLGNAITAAILLTIGLVRFFVSFAPGFGFLGFIIIYGWMASVYLRIVSETAAGNDDLPGIEMSGSWLEDIIYPALTFVVTFILAMLPNIAYYLLVFFDVLEPNSVILLTWTAIGILLWPMFMLLFALGVWRMIFRPDLILMTIAQSFHAYAAVWAVLLISSSLTLAGLAEDIFLEFGIDPFEYIPNIFHGFGLALGVQVLDVYLTVVSMRIIGLYYLHFKRKFAFKLE